MQTKVFGLIGNERKRILDTIGSFDPSGHQNIAIKLRQPGTGVWFTEGSHFKRWLETPNAKLWLYGIPGAGKTVLAWVYLLLQQQKLITSQELDCPGRE
jgi:hypothetical protein